MKKEDAKTYATENEPEPTATKLRTYRSATCPICGCSVIVWKHKKLKASLLRALALANHVRTSHPDTMKKGE